MVHVAFDPTSVRLTVDVRQEGGEYYIGKVFQRGKGIGYRIPHRGAGIGDVFASLWKYIKPIAMGAAKGVGEEALSAGSRILANLAQGADLRETVKKEGRDGVKRVIERASSKFQRGAGAGGRLKRIKGVKSKSQHAKKKRLDSLGFY